MVYALSDRFWRLRPKSLFFGIMALTFVLLLTISTLRIGMASAQNISVSSPNDCDANAVMWCGANTVNGVIKKYNNGDGHNSAASIQAVYSHFGISSAEIARMNDAGATVREGKVTRAGNVYVGGDIVATDAMTAGRQNMSGSTAVTSGGTTFYKRAPSVSFQSESLGAFVVMVNGRFSFAILASCGNPVKATPKAPAPQPKPTPLPPAPTPKPQPQPKPAPAPAPQPQPAPTNVCSGNTTNTGTNNGNGGVAQGGNCSNNTVVNNPPPAPQAVTPICTSLGVTGGDNRTVSISTFTTTAPSITTVDISWGDGNATSGATNAIGQTHQYAADGTYVISVVGHTTVDGKDMAVAGPACQQQVSFTTPGTPQPPTPPTPTVTTAGSTTPAPVEEAPSKLVNTGAGDVFGMFGIAAVVAGISTLAFRYALLRRLVA